MTAPSLTPGIHTVIVDARLFVPGQPLFDVPKGCVIQGVEYPVFRPDGYVEFRVRVGVGKKPVAPKGDA